MQTKKQDGFISVVALGLFAVLTVFVVIIQGTVAVTNREIRNTSNYYKAQDKADSTMEYLAYELKNHDAGYNFECDSENENGEEESVCSRLAAQSTDEIKISAKIKGRANDDSEQVTGTCPGFPSGQGCYVIPFPGTGDAGARCNLYQPFPIGNVPGSLATNPTDAATHINSRGQFTTVQDPDTTTPQIDYSCNWNKLSFGSKLTDRAVIPLYFDNGEEIRNTFNSQDSSEDSRFFVRMRTPCKPCKPVEFDEDGNRIDGNYDEDTYRTCTQGQDPTICNDPNDRYLLDESTSEILVNWQAIGTCNSTDICGLIQNDESSIKAETINEGILEIPSTVLAYNNEGQAIQTGEFGDSIEVISKFAENPELHLFLTNNKLLTELTKQRVPYLEYQFLSSKPTADPSTTLEVTVNVNGNVVERTIERKVQKDLVDFAIQN